jgi:hypothetical protein
MDEELYTVLGVVLMENNLLDNNNLKNKLKNMETKSIGSIVRPPQERKISDIAREIDNDWSKSKSGVYFGARPYLNAMYSLTTMDSTYGQDSARSIVNYFLGNAQTWRGETAKKIKLELNKLLKG